MNNFFNNQQILQVIWRRKVHFILIGVAAIALSAIFSGPQFIKPKFKSTARIYPINLEILSEESETEQMLEIVNSKDIKQKMFDAFDLDAVYEINFADPLYMTYMLNIYDKNVSASKTKFETVEIKVKDHNPHRASNMCDSIIHFYNNKVREMHRKKELEMVNISKKNLDQKYSNLETMFSKIDSLRARYGILDYKTQVKEVTEGYVNALAAGRASAPDVRKIRELYDNLASKGSEALWLESRLNYLVTSIDSLTNEYEFYLSESEKNITYAHVVEYPIPADKKSYPLRWLIVAASTLSALFLGLLVFLILDYRKKN
jgi:capsular polysaccharide biosynthesis protein